MIVILSGKVFSAFPTLVVVFRINLSAFPALDVIWVHLYHYFKSIHIILAQSRQKYFTRYLFAVPVLTLCDVAPLPEPALLYAFSPV